MATTTNYGWITPDDTALVKDGAAAIRTLGTSVDTTTKALNPSTTLGDIEYRSSTANTNTRLGIGTTDQVLTVTGGVPAWTTINAGGMTLLSTTTLSGASTTISGISGSFTNLQIFIYGVTNNTAAGNFTVSINNLGNNNNWTIAHYNNNGSTATRNNVNTAILLNSTDQFLRGDAGNFVSLTINNYSSGATYKSLSFEGYYVGVNYNEGFKGGGGFNSTAAISQIVLSNSGGTFSAGTCVIYGVK
jgi:hypothetical protein